MLLTKQEIIDLHLSTGDIYELAEAIERAVLAKAMPIPKQEPVGRISAVFNHGAGHFFNCEWFDHCSFKNGDFLYAEPVPAQAAAIPEYEIIGYTTRYLIDDCKKGHQSLYGSWLKEDCPKHDGVAIAVLSASPKPE